MRAGSPDTAIYRTDRERLVLVVGPATGSAQLSAAVELLTDAHREPCRELVLDVGHVHRMSSDLVALLLWANVRLQARGSRLAVARPSPATRELLRRTGLDHVLRVLDRVPAEVAA